MLNILQYCQTDVTWEVFFTVKLFFEVLSLITDNSQFHNLLDYSSIFERLGYFYFFFLENLMCISSVQFSRSVLSNSLQPHELQHARPPCPSPTPGFTQTHVHRVRDAIQPSHPWSSPSPPIPNPSEHRSLFQWVNSSHEVAKVLELQI